MICLLLIMTAVFVNGIASAEQRIKHSGTDLREEEMSAKTKAWLLMVESGKVDEEELRRITPKSIFIAPLLSGREEKCKEGYRYDHLGQCVKVIKIDPKAQLEMLLKRLNMLYSEKKENDREREKSHEVSSGPLHFSIPILSEEEKVKNEEKPSLEFEQIDSNNSQPQTSPEFIPIPLPMILMNWTNGEKEMSATNNSYQMSHTNNTKEFESSGMGPLNDSDLYVPLQLEGSGISSGDAPQDQDYTSTISLISEETDFLDPTENETMTEEPSATEESTESFSITPSPTAESVTTESYQSITDLPSVNDSIVDLFNETVPSSTVVESNLNSDIIHFPIEEPEVRTYSNSHRDSSYIRFPDDPPRTHSSYQSSPPALNWNPLYRIHPSAVPQLQVRWQPENSKVDETQQKPSLVKFWSRLPSIQDVSLTDDKNAFKKALPTIQPNPQAFNSLNKNNDYVVNFNHHQVPSRENKPFRSNRFQEIVPTPRQSLSIQR